MNEIECPCDCGFKVAIDDDGWRDELGDHIRWVHVANRDFGPHPAPALMSMMMNGVIEPDQFAEYMNASFKPMGMPWTLKAWYAINGAALVLGAVALAAFDSTASTSLGAVWQVAFVLAIMLALVVAAVALLSLFNAEQRQPHVSAELGDIFVEGHGEVGDDDE